ncbi:MAG TPA: mycothiol synthase [Acidimicrobiales bacterium]|nr:mycothiol synthase [Acidimicrobiales bacterium]
MVRIWPLDDPDRFGATHRERVDRLVVRAATATGHRPVSEQTQRVLDRPTPGASWVLFMPAGFGVLARDRAGWEVEIVVDPDARQAGETTAIEVELLRAALAYAAGRGGGTVRYWAFTVVDGHDDAVTALGFEVERTLLQMRVPLPLDPAVRPTGRPLAVRPFRPGDDDAAWLEANNRAFAGHPEQGDWDEATLLARQAEPWFDAAGFLLHEEGGAAGEGGRVAGSCWTKVHEDTTPPMGEIYVISVDPDFGGRGLGRALTIAGLDHLASLGLSVGMLYVDEANAAAVGLYRSLGFTVDHVDRAYVHVDRAYVIDAPTARPMP